MCLVAIAIDASRRFPLVVAANRDEYFDRPSARLGWWTPPDGGPEILGGRDLKAGGTWMGLTSAGRLALVTNVRRPVAPDPDAPSRGALVPLWLRTGLRPDQFWMHASLSGHAPFNLVAADFRRGDCFYATNQEGAPRRMERGIFGLSNAGLDTPWPKVVALKRALAQALEASGSADGLAGLMFEALASRDAAPEAELPATGIAHELERTLSAAFVRTPDGRYGTRCSTVIVAERVKRQLVTHVIERTFVPESSLALVRRARLAAWPPRYGDITPSPVDASSISESELLPHGATVPVKRTRVRTLLKPAYRIA